MSSIAMLIGLPASGKSTFRDKFLKAHAEYRVASSDDYIDLIAADYGISYSEAWAEHAKAADAWCRSNFNGATAEGRRVIVDRTNLTPKSRRSFLANVPRDYVKIAFVFEVDPDRLRERLAYRALTTGKFIPEAVIETMRKTYVAPSAEEFDIITRIVQ